MNQSAEEVFLRAFYKLSVTKQDVNKSKEFLLLTEYKKTLNNGDPDLQTKFDNQKTAITTLYTENETNKKLVADLTKDKEEMSGSMTIYEEKIKELEAQIVELSKTGTE